VGAKKAIAHHLKNQVLKPGGRIHLKTDSPDLYRFTKTVIQMYGCRLIKDLDDVYGEPGIPKELHIKTHYESLDIAKSNTVHYLCFSLPDFFPSKEMDTTLQELLKKEAGIMNEDDED
jgi:tRNA (guanine-N7-)-methyltransferase